MTIELQLLAEVPADAAVSVHAAFPGRLDAGPVPASALGALNFEGKADQLQVVPLDGSVVIVVGLGDPAAVLPTTLRRVGAQISKATKKYARITVAVLADLEAARAAAQAVDAEGPADPATDPSAGDVGPERSGEAQGLVEGLLLAAYEFTDHKSDPPRRVLTTIDLVVPSDAARAGAERGRVLADAVCLARDLVNEPGGSLTPRRLADRARKLAKKGGFEAKVYKRKELAEMGMGGLLGVNRGSSQPPRFVELRYRPNGESRGTVALVGKGITFDSGGLSLKTAAGMMTMKCDMAGAAAVLGAFVAISRLRPPVEVRGYLPMTDNMTGGDATRPGDVLRLRNGKTIEVLNTDAEGRLILADALSLASEARPDAMVDLATLTGACVVALGPKLAGLMGRDDRWMEQVAAAAAASGEPVWRLPLPTEYRKQYESNVADMKNIGSGNGGALVAGLILEEFVADGIAWAHLDIAGPAFTESEDAEVTKGGTGFGVRLLVELVERFRKPVAD